MITRSKHYIKILILSACIILQNCQLQEPIKNHGILFLENRSKKLVLNNSNKNDVLRIIGQPHSKSINNEKVLYFKKCLTGLNLV